MLLIIGWVIVFTSIVGGFTFAGGRVGALFVLAEYIIIGGVAIGYICAASPISVLKLMAQKILKCATNKGVKKGHFLDLIKALYELFMLAREQGMVGIEEDVLNPQNSAIFKKYPSFLADHHAVSFLQDNLRPIIDGKMKGEQIRSSLNEQLDQLHAHHAQPISVLQKLGDAMPGVGIVAAVMGVILTMSHIAGSKEDIGEHVAHALTGTFMGILISYGFIQPLTINLEFMDADEFSYYTVMSNIIISFTSGSAPLMASEAGRLAIPADKQIPSEELEAALKALNKKT